MPESFEQMLTGGHHNSLGRTEEVTELCRTDESRMEELYATYRSSDAVARMRVSGAFKRLVREKPERFVRFADRFLSEIADLDQASAQWTLALLIGYAEEHLNPQQLARAEAVMLRNLRQSTDWIVIRNSIEQLGKWAMNDQRLARLMLPELERLTEFQGKTVRKVARDWIGRLTPVG